MTIFTLSESATARVAWLLEKEPAGSALRVAVDGGGCSGFQYKMDFVQEPPQPGDTMVEQGGARVLIDEISLPFLEGVVLDYTEALVGSHFEFKNPNATAKCGCGNSFAV